MNVLLVTNLYPNKNDPNWGIFNYQQFEAFSLLSNIVTINPISWRTLRNWEKLGKAVLYFDSKNKVYHPRYYYTPRVFRCFYGVFYFFSILPRASKLIRELKPDVIIGTWAFPDGFAAVLLGKIFKLPVYIKVHGSDIHSVQGKCRERLTVWTLRSCKKVISVSNSLSTTMQNDFGIPKNKISVIPNGIFKDKFSPVGRLDAIKKLGIKASHKKNIVFVGNLKPVKNVMMLVEAFHKLHQEFSDSVALHILGAGVMYEEIHSYIKTYNLNGNVFLYGRVLHDCIPYWMNFADVFVLPSKNEGMPNVVLEALSCGTPVVASNIEATREIIDDGINGYLFDLQDLEDFVNKLKLGLSLKEGPEFDHRHDMIITWQENAQRLYQIIA